MARPTNLKLVTSQGHVISLNRVGPVAHESKTDSPSITEIGRRVPRDKCYIAH